MEKYSTVIKIKYQKHELNFKVTEDKQIAVLHLSLKDRKSPNDNKNKSDLKNVEEKN